MPDQAIVVVGASAGGVEALLALAGGLPPDLPAAVLVVLHTSSGPRALCGLLSRRGPLPAMLASDGASLEPGQIYLAPGDHHLLVAQGHMHLTRGARENGFRPAVDPLFRSAARVYGPQVIGVILSGVLDDGTAGLLAVKRRGGVAVVQDPDDAVAPGMPRSALAYAAVDEILPATAMGPTLGRLAATVAGRAEGVGTMPDAVTQGRASGEGAHTAEGAPTRFSCPECHGVLSEVYDGALLRFRCQVGHLFSPQSVAVDQATVVEQALWTALTALNERALLLERLARDARDRADIRAVRRFELRAHAAEAEREQMRRMLGTVTEAAGEAGGDPPAQEAERA